jgi:hypothetical protein
MCRGFSQETLVSIILLIEFLNSNEIIQSKSRTNRPTILAKNTITLAFTLPIQYVS